MFWNRANLSVYPSPQSLGLNRSIVARAISVGGPTRRCGQITSCTQARYSTVFGEPAGPPILSAAYNVLSRPFYQLGTVNGS